MAYCKHKAISSVAWCKLRNSPPRIDGRTTDAIGGWKGAASHGIRGVASRRPRARFERAQPQSTAQPRPDALARGCAPPPRLKPMTGSLPTPSTSQWGRDAAVHEPDPVTVLPLVPTSCTVRRTRAPVQNRCDESLAIRLLQICGWRSAWRPPQLGPRTWPVGRAVEATDGKGWQDALRPTCRAGAGPFPCQSAGRRAPQQAMEHTVYLATEIATERGATRWERNG
jgi:hypothetical protein